MSEEPAAEGSMRRRLIDALDDELTEKQVARVILKAVQTCAEHAVTEFVFESKSYEITETTIQTLREWSEAYKYSDPLFSVELDQTVEGFRQKLEVDW